MKIWDIDGDGDSTPLSDGLMIIKWIMGLRGDDLTVGAVNPAGARTTNAAIEGYLEMIEPYMDINGDGVVDFLDGWLILKAMFGLIGTNLTDDSIRPAATRTTSDELIAYMNKMRAEFP